MAQDKGRSLAFEGWTACEYFKEDTAETIEVRARIRQIPTQPFRACIREGSHQDTDVVE
jgi:hypothetical protein